MQSVEYAQGRFADVYGDPAERTVLMWHGAQVDARASMRLDYRPVHLNTLTSDVEPIPPKARTY